MDVDPTWELVSRLDLASGEVEQAGYRETPQGGGLVARANMTRTGVFVYRTPDGGVRRELRHPDEVFDADSLDSLAHAPLTDDHPSKPVTADSWRSDAIGHVAGRPHRSGRFVSGEIHVRHGAAVEKAKAGKMVELSCGYTCHFDATPGEYEGEPHDGSQRRIRYNHVAAGPAGWGRAGPEVRMRLDGGAGVSGSDDADAYVRDTNGHPNGEPAMAMTAEEKEALDAAKREAAEAKSRELAARKDADDAKSAEQVARQAEASAKGEKAVLEGKLSKVTTDAASRADAAKRELEVQELVQLRADAAEVFRDDSAWAPTGKDAETLMRELLAKMDPDVKLDAILAPLGDNAVAKSAVIKSTYAFAKSHFDKVRGASDLLEGVVRGDKKVDGDEQTSEDAYDEMVKKRRDRFKTAKDKKGSK